MSLFESEQDLILVYKNKKLDHNVFKNKCLSFSVDNTCLHVDFITQANVTRSSIFLYSLMFFLTLHLCNI